MKHSARITAMLVTVFILAQLAGLAVTAKYLNPEALAKGEIAWNTLPLGFERPQVAESTSYAYIFVALLIGTAIALLFVHLKAVRTWRIWFLLAVTLCLTFTFGVFFSQWVAFLLAAALAVWKVFRPNLIVHNLTEILLYGGIAAIFVPILNLFSVTILLLLIAGYDAFAVWQSKHMVKMAQFQSDANLFAGVFIPYEKSHAFSQSRPVAAKHADKGDHGRIAVLGGGDIAFPLLFTGAALKWLLHSHPLAAAMGFSLIITLFAALALTLLLMYAKPKTFYPAMPFIALGCFAGFGAVWLLA